MAAASSFSYAQAAKGQGTTPPQLASSNDTNQPSATPESSGDKPALAQEPVEIPTPTQTADSSSVTQDKQDFESVSAVESDTRTESVPERSSEPRRDDESSRRLDRPWRRNDKGTRSSSATTRSVDDQEPRRPRKGKKGKSSDKQNGDSSAAVADQESKAEEAPKIELLEAPIPSVNIWQQRKEAQLARTIPGETAHQDPLPGSQASTAPAAVDGGNSIRDTVPMTNGTKPHQKASDSNKPERQGSRGSRVSVKDIRTEAPPPVQDASLWPTPEISIKEDKKKPSEKELQEDPNSAKPRQKKEWVTYDYVPTVSFETQLPQMRGSKPRGGAKGASSSRASATGTQVNEKAGVVAPVSKGAESKERTREPASNTNGTASAPPAAKRTSADGSQPRTEQKRPLATQATEKSKDVPSSNHQTEHGSSFREGRSERGRGGYRGRGGHHGIHAHSQQQHNPSMAAPPYSAQGSMGSRSQSHYSPPPRQGGQNQVFMPANQRGGRGGRNGGSNYHRMSLPNGAARLPPVETQFPHYGYPVPPMSAVPFQQAPYWDSMVVAMVRNQVEYYFSIENLCKDMYLRKRMDSQGFVPLMFVTAFKRMRELAPEMALVRSVCEESNEVDYAVGEDDVERVRRRNGWQSFVLPMPERDELARNAGPIHLTFKNRSYAYPPQFNGMAPQVMTSPPYPPQSFVEDQHTAYAPNGLMNGNGESHGGNTQLSAAVPDFSPSRTLGDHGPDAPLEGFNNGQAYPPVNGVPNGVPLQ
jgi:la-related protein 1